MARRNQPRVRPRREQDPAQGLRQDQGRGPGPAEGASRRPRIRRPNQAELHRRPRGRRLAKRRARRPVGQDDRKNEHVLAPILATIGARKLRELTAADVHQALTTTARRYSTAAVAMGHNALTRAIRHAEARDQVGRNVAVLVDTPTGQAGRPSKSLSLSRRPRCWQPLRAPGCTPTSPYASRPASAQRRPARCAGSMSTSAIRMPGRPCLPAQLCGVRSEPTGTRRRKVAEDARPARDGGRRAPGP
jgi:hypothetical protein